MLGLGTGSGSHRHTGDSSVHLRHALLHPDLASASLELPGCLLTVGSVASSGLFVLLDIFSRGLWYFALTPASASLCYYDQPFLSAWGHHDLASGHRRPSCSRAACCPQAPSLPAASSSSTTSFSRGLWHFVPTSTSTSLYYYDQPLLSARDGDTVISRRPSSSTAAGCSSAVVPAEPLWLPLRSTTTNSRFSPRGMASSAAGFLHGGGIACCSLPARGACAASTWLYCYEQPLLSARDASAVVYLRATSVHGRLPHSARRWHRVPWFESRTSWFCLSDTLAVGPSPFSALSPSLCAALFLSKLRPGLSHSRNAPCAALPTWPCRQPCFLLSLCFAPRPFILGLVVSCLWEVERLIGSHLSPPSPM